MAIVTKLALAAALTPQNNASVFSITKNYPVKSGDAASGDVVELMTFNRAGTIFGASIGQSATLGASATVKLAIGDGTTNVDLTAATTAATASTGRATATQVPVRFTAGQKLYAVVGGAAITAPANLQLDLVLGH